MSEKPTNSQPAQPGPLAAPEPWNLVADGYEQITRKFLAQYSRSGLAMLRYGPETRAVDVACGPGTTTLLLAPSVKHVACLDFSAAMLDKLDRNVAAAGITNVEIVHGDGQALPFGDNSFDVGVSMFGLMFFPDRAKGFSELCRVLIPGGQVLVSSWAPADQSPLMRTVIAALQADDAPPQPVSRLSGLEDRDLFESEMRAGGFTDIRIEPVTHGMAVENVDQFWDETVRAMAPVTLLKRNSSAEEWRLIETQALGRLRAALADLPRELTSTAYLAVARKG
jgi:ubiquinone/menaquinone biosynthesis C-methylase UbiE